MVNNLLDTLLGKKPQEVKKVNEESKVFEEGELGSNPSGGNLSTYKELCSLATDMGQPDLVYKFMHLANYNATWNSKKGAAFGFSTIASKAGDQLEPLLPKIIPKLYRYQYDPTPRIQQSMSSIWAALVPETTKTVDKFLPAILAELQKELTSPQWRVRESCCVGLTDLLRGRTLDDALDTLTLLWQDIFRVMDDIKESVRVAAAKTAQSLSRVSIKMCDVSIGAKAGEAAVKAILPPLLEKGLTSTVSEVRAVCLATLMKVTKSAGPLLAPHLGVLVPALLEATGEMEGQQLNYISTRLGVDQGIQERLDSARMAASKSSPTMECVTYCLQFIDGTVLGELVPRLVDCLKGSVSIVTRGGAAHVITSLTHQCPLDLQPYTGKLLSAFVTGLSDRNPGIRLYLTEIMELLPQALESGQWAVKAQAARAMGTVVTKLGGTIQSATQRKLVTHLLTGLQGRTWTGKECLLRSLSDLAVSAGDILSTTLAQAKNEEPTTDQLIAALFKECKKEKPGYRLVALETTGSVLKQLKLDRFKELYMIVSEYLPKQEVEGSSDKENGEKEVDQEESQARLELQHAVLVSLGLAWPANKETQEQFLLTMVDHLHTMLVLNTTRKNQLAIAVCLGSLISQWKFPSDLSTSDATRTMCSEVFSKVAKIISCLLLIPKYAQLRTETLQVLGQTIKLLVESKSKDLVYLFRDEITKSLDGVIKDLGSDPNTKTTARDLKTALNAIQTEEKKI